MRPIEVIEADLGRLEEALASFDGQKMPAHTGFALAQRSLLDLHAEAMEELRAAVVYGQRPVVDFLFSGGAAGDELIDAGFLSQVVQRLQDAVYALVQAEVDEPRLSGTFSDAVRQIGTLRIAGIGYGSFGVLLAGPPLADQQELIDNGPHIRPPLEAAVGRVMDLVSAAAKREAPDEVLLDLAGELPPRAISHLRDLIRSTAQSGSRLEIAWTTPFTDRRQTEIGQVDASRLAALLEQIDPTEDERELSGTLRELSDIRDTFGLDSDDGGIVRGRVSKDLRGAVGSYYLKRCVATLSVDIVRNKVTRQERTRYTLVDVRPEG